MAIKILHTADFHMDSPFHSLPDEKAKIRRREQRAMFQRIAAVCEEEEVQLLLLAGDLFDSNMAYQETVDTVAAVLSKIETEVFITPGNHDYLCLKSPYYKMELPDNVHIFASPSIKCVELPRIGCRVWGAGFTSSRCGPLLEKFSTGYEPMIDIMVLHGDLLGGPYNPITPEQIANTGLDYLALGHVHSFDGFHKAGKTVYAYSGCPEGRGFDELGEKGYIIGTVDKDNCDLAFIPAGGRQYRIESVDVTGKMPDEAVSYIDVPSPGRDICRIVLTGEYDGDIDVSAVSAAVSDKFFHVELRDETRPTRDLWAEAGDDTLKGLFVRRMRAKYDEADDEGKKQILDALAFGVGALENREEWR